MMTKTAVREEKGHDMLSSREEKGHIMLSLKPTNI